MVKQQSSRKGVSDSITCPLIFMLVSELKKVINTLPPECDGFSVEFMAQVIPLSEGRWAREDHPISGSILDMSNREFVLGGKEQLEKFSAYAQQIQNPGRDPGQRVSALDPNGSEQNRQ